MRNYAVRKRLSPDGVEEGDSKFEGRMEKRPNLSETALPYANDSLLSMRRIAEAPRSFRKSCNRPEELAAANFSGQSGKMCGSDVDGDKVYIPLHFGQ